ncbi:Hint domain-containing protein [Sedimentitalea sp. JM2-8]|uniref:Hint domain-containing protein n=1 Tax=Sedimentitalea xiamensis TaxID=3050037 RepID=A0ABT7FKE8_9RHOB|nr:Hint domain-containing protein [Sedimentitalea xiamensis]MDK3075538.1 Hint domain-containing protein [Sedimentitalea xiamensis]
MAEIVSFNPGLGIVIIAAAPGEDVSGWTFESYTRSGNFASYVASGPVDFSDPQVSASDPSLIYYTSDFGLPQLNQRDAVAFVDGNGSLVETIGWGNDSTFFLTGGTANGELISPGSGNYAGDNNQGWYSKLPGDPWTGNNGSPDDGLPDDLIPFVPPCFAAGTLIDTPDGPRRVETLRPGDPVLTAGGDTRVIRWAGRTIVRFSERGGPEHLRPILIRADAFGPGSPDSDLRVSPQHRIVSSGLWNDVLFGSRDVLVAAKHFVNGTTVVRDDLCGSVEYVHVLLDRHEILVSNGVPSESYHPGPMTVGALDRSLRDELFEIFPDLQGGAPAFGDSCLPVLRAWEARLL